jgi:hypothetical protein
MSLSFYETMENILTKEQKNGIARKLGNPL